MKRVGSKSWLAAAATWLIAAAPAGAQTVWNVNNDTSGDATGLAYALANAQSGDTINLTGNITISGSDLPTVSQGITINGNGFTLDGGGAYRGLLVAAFQSGSSNPAPVSATIANLTIQNTLAQGGAGGSGNFGGGGGGGLGGGLFVASGATVTASNINFQNNSAAGGAGGAGALCGSCTVPANGAGGGGGMGGNGGIGAGGGGVGGSDGTFNNPRFIAGAGGFGGGGGAGVAGGNGGFGGGGGAALNVNGFGTATGAGGFGGGGAGGGGLASPGAPGFGGGHAASFVATGGGGGAGMGGAIFVQNGGTLTLGGNVTLNGASVSVGAGGNGGGGNDGTAGLAFGAGIFLQGNGNLVFAPAAASTQTVSNVIADQTGVGGTASNLNPALIGVGSYTLTKNGAGNLTLGVTNTYSGGTTVNAGTLTTTASGALGAGAVAVSGGTLAIGGNETVATLNNGVGGAVTLGGGTLSTTTTTSLTSPGRVSLLNAGSLSGHGTINGPATFNFRNNGSATFSGGTTTINQSVNNLGTMTVANSTATFNTVTNQAGATFSVQHGQAKFAGAVTNNGAFISDPSTMTFQSDLGIGATGFIAAASGDLY